MEKPEPHILAQTGIQVEWLNCAAGSSHVPDQFEQPSPCSRIGYPSHLSVRVVLAGRSLREDIFGGQSAIHAVAGRIDARAPCGGTEEEGVTVAHPFRCAGFPIPARISIVAGAVGAETCEV